jgi:hypothetical protein
LTIEGSFEVVAPSVGLGLALPEAEADADPSADAEVSADAELSAVDVEAATEAAKQVSAYRHTGRLIGFLRTDRHTRLLASIGE